MYQITRFLCLMALVMLMLLSPTANASAALLRCRTDPVFVLSNGDVISIIVDIGTDASNIKNISYLLHVPSGVTVKRVAYTAVNLGIYEKYQVSQDSPARTYTVDTIVTLTNLSSVDVIVSGRLNSGVTKSVSGFTGKHLFITLIRP